MTKKKSNPSPSQAKPIEQNVIHKSEKVVANVATSLKENQWYYYIGLALVLLLIYMIRKNFLEIPFERDEGSYMYSGETILHGAIPFKDIGSQRLDGVFYAYALLVGIFGYTVKSMHLAFIFLNIGTTYMLFFLVRKLTNNMAGIAAALFFALISMAPVASGFTIQSEHIVAFLVAGAFLTLIHFFESKNILLLILSGILFSFAFQVKQTSAFYGMLAGAILVFKELTSDKKSIKHLFLYVLVFASSVIMPLVIDLLIIYKRGAWADFHLWFFDIRKQYTSASTLDEGIQQLIPTYNQITGNYQFFWIASYIGTVIVLFTSLPWWKKLLIAGLNIAGFLTIVPGYHFYGHYFLQWLPAIAVNGAMFVYCIQEFLARKVKINMITIVVPLALIALPAFSNLQTLSNYYFSPNYDEILREVYGVNPFPESKVIADKLNSMMKKEDKIAVFGTEIQMYVYTNKISPSRFAGSGALLEFPVAKSNEWQKEFMSDVEKAAPRFLVFFSHPISWMVNPKSENLIFPWFDKFSREHYEMIGFADIYGNGTRYAWKSDPTFQTDPPKSDYRIFIYERIQ